MTDRREKFVLEYLGTGNAAESARRAGYSARNAHKQGHKLLQCPDVRAAIDSRMKELSGARVAEVQEVLEYLTRLIRGEEREDIATNSGKVLTINVSHATRLKAADFLLRVHGAYLTKASVEVKDTSLMDAYVQTLTSLWEEDEPEPDRGAI